EMYDAALKGKYIIGIDHFNDLGNSSAHLYLSRVPNITLEQRNEIINKMAEKGIATNVHYKPLPMHTAYKALGFDIKNYPNAYSQFLNEITLPLHTLLTNEEIQYVIKSYIMSITEVK
ncbi:MAG: DegT/DnrJ/EryC1/StrS family aminotransferase, partial [Clostridia bacterium]